MLDVGNDSREDYLINILRLSEDGTAVGTSALADYMGVSPGSVTEMLKVLKKQNADVGELVSKLQLTFE